MPVVVNSDSVHQPAPYHSPTGARAGWWDVRVEFDTSRQLETGDPERLSAALTATAEASRAVAYLADRGTAVAIGATLVLAASTPAEAIAAALDLFPRTCAKLDLNLTQFREATITPAWLDPRD